MKVRWMALLIVMAIVGFPTLIYAQETDPAAVVMARVEALKAGDVKAATALFTDDAVYEISDPQLDFFLTLAGKEEIGNRHSEVVGLNGNLEVEIRQVDGNTVTAFANFSDDELWSEGLAYIQGLEEYTIQEGKITSYKWTTQGVVPDSAPAALPESGGMSFPSYALILTFGALVLLSGFGLALRGSQVKLICKEPARSPTIIKHRPLAGFVSKSQP